MFCPQAHRTLPSFNEIRSRSFEANFTAVDSVCVSIVCVLWSVIWSYRFLCFNCWFVTCYWWWESDRYFKHEKLFVKATELIRQSQIIDHVLWLVEFVEQKYCIHYQSVSYQCNNELPLLLWEKKVLTTKRTENKYKLKWETIGIK